MRQNAVAHPNGEGHAFSASWKIEMYKLKYLHIDYCILDPASSNFYSKIPTFFLLGRTRRVPPPQFLSSNILMLLSKAAVARSELVRRVAGAINSKNLHIRSHKMATRAAYTPYPASEGTINCCSVTYKTRTLLNFHIYSFCRCSSRSSFCGSISVS